MKRPVLFLLLFLLQIPLYAQLTLIVTSIPSNTPPGDTIYVAGTFNNWDPGNASYILTNNQNGTFEISLDIPAGAIKYKFTRGNWDAVEGDANGNYLPDRTYTYSGAPTTLPLTIQSWEDQNANSTREPNVTILATDFEIPQLNRTRRIWIYLPPDYDASNKSYPVLYMHDGQNLFDNATAFSGEWEVDESLNELFQAGDNGVIVVGIDNGGANRLHEYSPWVNPSYGGGQGDEYMDFIVHTLKPHIDTNFRTMTDRDHTGMLGSSMGGLITMYGAIEYQEFFSKAGVFSPSFWFSDNSYSHVSNTGKEADMRFYFVAGAREGTDVIGDVNDMENTLLQAGFTPTEIKKAFHADGQHSEWYWNREFPAAYIWLFREMITSLTGNSLPITARIFPNPASDTLHVQASIAEGPLAVYLFDNFGRLVRGGRFSGSLDLNIRNLPAGLYFVLIKQQYKTIFQERLIKN